MADGVPHRRRHRRRSWWAACARTACVRTADGGPAIGSADATRHSGSGLLEQLGKEHASPCAPTAWMRSTDAVARWIRCNAHCTSCPRATRIASTKRCTRRHSRCSTSPAQMLLALGKSPPGNAHACSAMAASGCSTTAAHCRKFQELRVRLLQHPEVVSRTRRREPGPAHFHARCEIVKYLAVLEDEEVGRSDAASRVVAKRHETRALLRTAHCRFRRVRSPQNCQRPREALRESSSERE
jgi:hypothetical protein